jgi:hypothetical protein
MVYKITIVILDVLEEADDIEDMRRWCEKIDECDRLSLYNDV